MTCRLYSRFLRPGAPTSPRKNEKISSSLQWNELGVAGPSKFGCFFIEVFKHPKNQPKSSLLVLLNTSIRRPTKHVHAIIQRAYSLDNRRKHEAPPEEHCKEGKEKQAVNNKTHRLPVDHCKSCFCLYIVVLKSGRANRMNWFFSDKTHGLSWFFEGCPLQASGIEEKLRAVREEGGSEKLVGLERSRGFCLVKTRENGMVSLQGLQNSAK